MCRGQNLLNLCELWKNDIFIVMTSSGGACAVDSERRLDPGEQRPELPAAEDSFWTDSLLLHPADLPLHLREQKDGHHRQGVELVFVTFCLAKRVSPLLCNCTEPDC